MVQAMIIFVSVILLNMSWVLSSVAILLSVTGNIIVMVLNFDRANLQLLITAHILFLFVITYIVYYGERRCKEAFIALEENKQLTSDFKNILEVVPEAIIIFDENQKNHSIMKNSEF